MVSRSLPHGLCSLFLVVVAGTGWFASLWQGDGCNYAIVTGPIVGQLESDPSVYYNQNPITTLELGFDSYRELPNVVSIDLDANVGIGVGIDGTGMETENGKTSTDETATASSIATNTNLITNTNTSLSKSFSTTSVSNATDSNLQQLLRPRQTSCILYPEEITLGIIDSSWTTSRSFAFFGLVLGGAGTTFLGCSLCFVFSRVTWRWTGYALLLAAVFQALSLVAWFRTQLCSWNRCGWSLGSISDVCALSIWAVAGVAILGHYPSPAFLVVAGTTTGKQEGSIPVLPIEAAAAAAAIGPQPKQPHRSQSTIANANTNLKTGRLHETKQDKNNNYDNDFLVDIETHHSYDADEEYDKRRYPNAKMA